MISLLYRDFPGSGNLPERLAAVDVMFDPKNPVAGLCYLAQPLPASFRVKARKYTEMNATCVYILGCLLLGMVPPFCLTLSPRPVQQTTPMPPSPCLDANIVVVHTQARRRRGGRVCPAVLARAPSL
jgi:hypothetical protein